VSSFKDRLKKIPLFGMISWLRNAYARESIDYAKMFKQCGKGVRIDSGVSISNCHMITVGDNVIIHKGVIINGAGGLHIGSNSGISFDTIIWTVEHNYVSSERIPFGCDLILKPVRINDNVMIGSGVRISPGVEIGEGAVIGMASLVTKDIPPLSIVMGSPARVIGQRDKEHYERAKSEGRFVQHSVYSRMIVPQYIQKRPNLFDIIRDEVEKGEIILEPESSEKKPE
jgi:acetyltransferase-like isoleucine patch superfamily enzyme